MTFQQKLDKIIKKNNSLLCIGLDSSVSKLPSKYKTKDYPQFAFNKWIIEQTYDKVCAYKPNTAFYEAEGADGIKELEMTCHYLVKYYPNIPIILDAKRGDIGSSNKGYIQFAFEYLGADAITLHPYLGKEALQPFLDQKEKGCIILCRTSNPGAGEFQNLSCHSELARLAKRDSESRDKKTGFPIPPDLPGRQTGAGRRVWDDNVPLYAHIASKVTKEWNSNGNCLLVVGATYPKELSEIRQIVGDMTLLIPGIGAQGGDLKATLRAGLDKKGKGIIINSSRGIIFSKNPGSEAEKLKEEINKFR